MTKYSHTVSRVRQYREADGESWFVGYDYVGFVIMIFFIDFLITTYYRVLPVEDINVVTFQIMMLLVGLAFGVIFLLSNRQKIRTGLPNKTDVENLFLYGMGGYVMSELLCSIFIRGDFNLYLPYLPSGGHFVLSAAFVEEALYSLLFTAGLFIMLMKVINTYITKNKDMNIMAKIFVCLVVAVAFSVMHIAAYGVDVNILGTIFISRFIYSFTFLQTRNIMVPTIQHLIHNGLVLSMLLLL